MKIVVTGASGHLGRLVVEKLLETVPANQIVAAVRTPTKAADLAARGVDVRQADYTKPATLETAFAGADRLVLVSSSEVGQRAVQHSNAVDAAKDAGVKLVAYTSILRADTSPLALATEHAETESYIRASGLPYVFLRNGWYLENYTENLAPALAHGAILGSANGARISAAARADFAAAAAAVISGSGHEGQVYELAGDRAFMLDELAAEVSRQSGKGVVYKDLPPAEYVGVLVGAGVPKPFAEILADSDVGAATGALFDDSGTLRRLIGRPTTPLADAVARAVHA